MPPIRFLIRLCAVLTVLVALNACVTMDDVNQSYNKVRERITQLDIPKPQPTTADTLVREEDQNGQTETTAPVIRPEDSEKTAAAEQYPEQDMASPAVKSKDIACFDATIIDDLRTLRQFSTEKSAIPENMISEITMSSIEAHCQKNDHNIIIDLDITFEGKIGPQGFSMNEGETKFIYPYFLAVMSPNGAIISKEIFAVPLSYKAYELRTRHTENIRQIIPTGGQLYNDRTALNIGFQLTTEQLSYNRLHPYITTPVSFAPPAQTNAIPQNTQDSIESYKPPQMITPKTTAAATPTHSPAPTAIAAPAPHKAPTPALALRKKPAPPAAPEPINAPTAEPSPPQPTTPAVNAPAPASVSTPTNNDAPTAPPLAAEPVIEPVMDITAPIDITAPME